MRRSYLFLAIAVFLCITGLYLWKQPRPLFQIAEKQAEATIPSAARDLPAESEPTENAAGVPASAVVYDENPRIHAAYEKLANLEWDAALTLLLEIQADEAENLDVLSGLVNAYVNGPKNLQKARETIERIIQIDPNSSGIYERYEVLSIEAKQIDQALDFLLRRTADANPDLFLAIAHLHKEKQDYEKALVAMESALNSKHRYSGQVLEEMADIYRAQKNLAMARQTLQRALAYYEEHNANPDNQGMEGASNLQAIYKMIEVSIDLKDADTASSLLQPLIHQDPSDPKLQRYQSAIQAIASR